VSALPTAPWPTTSAFLPLATVARVLGVPEAAVRQALPEGGYRLVQSRVEIAVTSVAAIASGQMQTEDTLRPGALGGGHAAPRARARVPTVGVAPLGASAGRCRPGIQRHDRRLPEGLSRAGAGAMHVRQRL
jgi:hypothetical protein